MSENTTVDFDSLLDADLSQFADAKEFGRMGCGTYRVAGTLSVEEGKNSGKRYLKFTTTVLEVVETVDGETPAEVGSENNFSFFIDSEFGQGQFKKLFDPIKEQMGLRSTRDLVDNTAGTSYLMVVGKRQGKKDDLDDKGQRKLYAEILGLIIE